MLNCITRYFLLWNQNRTNVISELCALINTGVQKLLVLFKVELVLKDKLRAQVWNPRSAFAELPNWCVSSQSENNWSSQVNPGLGNNAAAAAANRTFYNINWQIPMFNEWLNKRHIKYFCFYFPLVMVKDWFENILSLALHPVLPASLRCNKLLPPGSGARKNIFI